jgi:hypothetical protein
VDSSLEKANSRGIFGFRTDTSLSDNRLDDLLAIMPPVYTDPIIIPDPILRVNSFCGLSRRFICKNHTWPKKCRSSSAADSADGKVLPVSIPAPASPRNCGWKRYCGSQPVDRKIFFVFVLDEQPST